MPVYQSWKIWPNKRQIKFPKRIKLTKLNLLPCAYFMGHTVVTNCSPPLNSLRPSDAIWRQWFWTTLAQVMACCLTAPSHYLNQCWLIIRGVLWHTSESSFAGIAQGIDSGYEFEKDILKNIFKSPRGQWVKCHFTTSLCWRRRWVIDVHCHITRVLFAI